MKNKLHPIQAHILKQLLFKPIVRFTDLASGTVSSDHFSFHIKRLSELGLVVKANDSGYALTDRGKEFANTLDVDGGEVVVERQAKIAVLVGCVDDSKKERRYLVQQRLKQPYYGFYGMLTGKVKWGEQVGEGAARELLEETGLTADISLVGVKHKMDYAEAGNLLEDKYFFVFRAENARGALLETFEGGRNVWLTERELFSESDVFDGMKDTLELLRRDRFDFIEKKYTVKKY